MFSRFIEQRSFVTAQDSLLAFFDNCLEKVSVLRCVYSISPDVVVGLFSTLVSDMCEEKTDYRACHVRCVTLLCHGTV